MLLTFTTISAILVGCALGAFYAIYRKPPNIEIKLPPYAPIWQIHVDTSQLIPGLIRIQHVPPDEKVATDEPIPADILAYLDLESEQSARDIRKRHARTLRHELGSWDAAFKALQLEDEP